MDLQVRLYLREIADVVYRLLQKMMYLPHKHSLMQRTLIVVLYAAIIRRDIAAGSLALAHKDMLAGIMVGWL